MKKYLIAGILSIFTLQGALASVGSAGIPFIQMNVHFLENPPVHQRFFLEVHGKNGTVTAAEVKEAIAQRVNRDDFGVYFQGKKLTDEVLPNLLKEGDVIVIWNKSLPKD